MDKRQSNNMERHWANWSDEHPDYCEAHVKLIDALRDYVAASDDIESDLRMEGDWDPDPDGIIHMQTVRLLLKELEAWSFDPTLGGRLKERKDG
jgi:hypothetical protein